MKIKISKGESIFNVFNCILMAVIMGVMLYPLLHVVNASLSDSNQLMQTRGFLLYPHGFNLESYVEVFKNKFILTGYQNTLINLAMILTLNMVLTCLGGYALSRKELLIRRPLMLLITFTMFFSGGLIPTYLIVRGLNMVGTRYALIIPYAISAYNLIIMRSAFENVPESLIESAKLDGANDFVVLLRIALPVSMATVAVMILFYGVSYWNSWFPAYIYLKEKSMFPLQLILREIVVNNNIDDMLTGVDASDRASIGESIKYSTVVVATVPILFAYPFLQKFFVKGVMIGAVKG